MRRGERERAVCLAVACCRIVRGEGVCDAVNMCKIWNMCGGRYLRSGRVALGRLPNESGFAPAGKGC